MILIADGGSSKVDWVLLEPNKKRCSEAFSGSGLNPVYLSDNELTNRLQDQFSSKKWRDDLEALHFYGAGCATPLFRNRLHKVFRHFFPSATIEVSHDLMGAARATCLHNPGIPCILGTGSNSCLYDGEKIIDQVANLGYLIGDEGSGTHLGKEFLRAYFYRELPEYINKQLEAEFDLERKKVLEKLYGNQPNLFLASFVPFISLHQQEEPVGSIIQNVFGEFIKRHVLKYADHQTLPIHFVGSISYYFKSHLINALESFGLNAGRIVQKPIEGLLGYHIQEYS